jgi:serine/threonine protein kinase
MIHTGVTSHKRYELTTLLAEGGEGQIYTIKNRPDIVAKTFKPHYRTTIRAQKITRMIELPTIAHTSWPIETLTVNGAFTGYVMTKIDGAQSIHHIFNPRNKLALGYNKCYEIALNIAKCVANIHQHGHILGDINESNFLYRNNGEIYLVDVDSIQVESYLCHVGKPEYTPPELSSQDLSTTVRSSNHDNFGLAVIIFQLLMGVLPFNAIPRAQGAYRGTRIDLHCKNHSIFPHIPNTSYAPPPHGFTFRQLPDKIQPLFEKAFTTHTRPTAQEWVSALESILSSMQKCNNNHLNPPGKQCYTCHFTSLFSSINPPPPPPPSPSHKAQVPRVPARSMLNWALLLPAIGLLLLFSYFGSLLTTTSSSNTVTSQLATATRSIATQTRVTSSSTKGIISLESSTPTIATSPSRVRQPSTATNTARIPRLAIQLNEGKDTQDCISMQITGIDTLYWRMSARGSNIEPAVFDAAGNARMCGAWISQQDGFFIDILNPAFEPVLGGSAPAKGGDIFVATWEP